MSSTHIFIVDDWCLENLDTQLSQKRTHPAQLNLTIIAVAAERNSASVDERATVRCFLELYEIGLQPM